MADAVQTEPDAASELTSLIIKAAGMSDLAESNQRSPEDQQFDNLGGLPVPYPPEALYRIFERSSALRPCVDAITTNVHGFGLRWVPTIDLATADSAKLIAESILAERIFDGDDDPEYPSDVEIADRKKEVERGIQIETIRMRTFMRGCSADGFAVLKAKVWDDYEITGNGYIEVLRNPATGRVTQFVYVPAITMRLRKRDAKPTVVDVKIKVGETRFGEIQRQIRFRSYVQSVHGFFTYFKDFGDPRPMDAGTGNSYARVEDMPPGAKPATEIIHFAVSSGRSNYGIPRWIGAIFEVLGIRAASEVNYLVFDNKGIPPYMILVSGGSLTKGASDQVKAHIQARIKGRQNYHAPLIIEAAPQSGANDPAAIGRVRIHAIPMTQPQDGTHLVYVDMAEDTIARQFRLSPITRGKTKDYNRATADAAMMKDEQQVFQPARRAFDERFNGMVLADLGIRFIEMESNSPEMSDSEQIARIVDLFVQNGTLVPGEARRFAGKALNEELPQIDAPWTQQPLALTLAGIPLAQTSSDPAADVETSANLMQRLVGLRDQLKSQGETGFEAAQAKSRQLEARGEAEVLHVPPSLMATWIRPSAGPRPNEFRDDNEDDRAS